MSAVPLSGNNLEQVDHTHTHTHARTHARTHTHTHTHTCLCHQAAYLVPAWASAYRGKWGQLIPLKKMDEKLKSENMQKEQFFYVYIIF